MRTKILALVIILLTAINLQGQTVAKAFTWQGIIKDDTNNPVANHSVNIRIGIRESTTTGNLVYREAHQVTTSPNGYVTLEIGNGQPIIGSLAAIDWTANNYFQEIELDIVGNGNFQVIGTSPIRPIPLAIDVLNKNKHVKVVNADNYQSVSLEEKDKIHIEGAINVVGTSTNFNKNHLHIYGGNFDGNGSGKINFGDYTVIKNTHFKDIKLDGSSIIFENCHFEGTIEFPDEGTLLHCVLKEVNASVLTRLDKIQNSTIENSTIPRINIVFNSELKNSNLDFSIYHLRENTLQDCMITISSRRTIMTDNIFLNSKIITKSLTSVQEIIISSNTFIGAYANESEVIKLDYDHYSNFLYNIVNNVFRLTDDDLRSIHVSSNSAGGVLSITNNTFCRGTHAIINDSNSCWITVNDNKLYFTDLGVANNDHNLRAFDNIDFF